MFRKIIHIFTPLVLFVLYLVIIIIKLNLNGQSSPEALEIFTIPSAVIIISAIILDAGCRFVFSNKTGWIWLTEIIILLIAVYLWVIQ
jgi:hypothetical protein